MMNPKTLLMLWTKISNKHLKDKEIKLKNKFKVKII